MTLIRVFQAFTDWLKQHTAVRVVTFRPTSQSASPIAPSITPSIIDPSTPSLPQTDRAALNGPTETDVETKLERVQAIRSSARLQKELTISPNRVRGANQPLIIHALEQRDGNWILTAGGSYQQVSPGIYDLFDTLTITISQIPPTEMITLLCPYCYSLLFGIDAESCEHLFLRLSPDSYWSPTLDSLLAELKTRFDLELNGPTEFLRFLKANPQLEWQRLVHREPQATGEVVLMAYVGIDPMAIFIPFPPWLLKPQAPRATGRGKRPTERQHSTKPHLKKELDS